MPMSAEGIDFVVGRERGLREVLNGSEVLRLLRRAVEAGMGGVALSVDGGEVLWFEGIAPGEDAPALPLFLEGEPVGHLRFVAGNGREAEGMARVVAGALQGMIEANLRRMLTTEIHTQVVNLSYEELLESNRLLSASEGRYRELAATLEVRVRERTEELKRLYAHLIQQEKMASVGQLAAGMAHEINNPLGFILSNLRTLGRYCGRLSEMLEFYRAGAPPGGEGEKLWDRLKIAFIRGDLEDLLSQSITGAERIRKIVADLRGFSHIDDIGASAHDLGAEIDRVLDVMALEIPPGTRIVREYAPLTPLRCEGGKLAQALFNLLRNAFQSRREGLEVVVRTEVCGQGVRITVADNGPGIPDEIRSRIFEPFFTTRPVGEGMGVGLTVAYNHVKGCGGSLRLEERPEGGAAFVIDLPPEEPADAQVC